MVLVTDLAGSPIDGASLKAHTASLQSDTSLQAYAGNSLGLFMIDLLALEPQPGLHR